MVKRMNGRELGGFRQDSQPRTEGRFHRQTTTRPQNNPRLEADILRMIAEMSGRCTDCGSRTCSHTVAKIGISKEEQRRFCAECGEKMAKGVRWFKCRRCIKDRTLIRTRQWRARQLGQDQEAPEDRPADRP